MSKKKVNRLLNPETGLMECRVCGRRMLANRITGGKFRRGSWQCRNGCKEG